VAHELHNTPRDDDDVVAAIDGVVIVGAAAGAAVLSIVEEVEEDGMLVDGAILVTPDECHIWSPTRTDAIPTVDNGNVKILCRNIGQPRVTTMYIQSIYIHSNFRSNQPIETKGKTESETFNNTREQ
jgi:hypothetical protein